MTYTPDDFDDCAYTHAPQQVQADRDLSHADRDAVYTAAQRRHITLQEILMSAVGALVIAAMLAISTQGWWRPWLGWS